MKSRPFHVTNEASHRWLAKLLVTVELMCRANSGLLCGGVEAIGWYERGDACPRATKLPSLRTEVAEDVNAQD
jgi:hypothetical protein